jgi:hypothetical protein
MDRRLFSRAARTGAPGMGGKLFFLEKLGKDAVILILTFCQDLVHRIERSVPVADYPTYCYFTIYHRQQVSPT